MPLSSLGILQTLCTQMCSFPTSTIHALHEECARFTTRDAVDKKTTPTKCQPHASGTAHQDNFSRDGSFFSQKDTALTTQQSTTSRLICDSTRQKEQTHQQPGHQQEGDHQQIRLPTRGWPGRLPNEKGGHKRKGGCPTPTRRRKEAHSHRGGGKLTM